MFLGPRVPLEKIWITYIQAYMPHESSEDSLNQPNGPGDPLDAPLEPLGAPGPPIDPLRHLNRSPGLIELLKSPQLPYKSLEDPSNVAVDPMGHFISSL